MYAYLRTADYLAMIVTEAVKKNEKTMKTVMTAYIFDAIDVQDRKHLRTHHVEKLNIPNR
jgi:hypothetical protein